MPQAGTAAYIRQVAVSPFGSEITIEAARFLIADEGLGMDEYPDILAINLSSNDYVGHAYGPESLEVEDMCYRTDRLLGELADFIDERLEGRPWVFVFSADHGVAPIPERLARRKIPARRDPLDLDLKGRAGGAHQSLEAYLRKRLGVDARPSLVRAFVAGQVFLRTDHPALAGSRFVDAQNATRDWLLTQEAVAAAVTREQFLSGQATAPLEAAMRRSFHPRRSGDVFYCFKPYDIPGDSAATHGSPWEFDTHVPLLMTSFGKTSPAHRLVAGQYRRQVSPASIAPTLAALLEVPPPGGCVEEALVEALPPSEPRAAKPSAAPHAPVPPQTSAR
jgi:arylsulfatase A-like enzyme